MFNCGDSHTSQVQHQVVGLRVPSLDSSGPGCPGALTFGYSISHQTDADEEEHLDVMSSKGEVGTQEREVGAGGTY